jgi:hypothetical protein
MKNGQMKLGIMPEGAGCTGSDWLNPGMPLYRGKNFAKHSMKCTPCGLQQGAGLGNTWAAEYFTVALVII